MADRPYTLLSCCVSLDGCLDTATGPRLVLSGPEDLDRVDALRAASDAILVGANTIRRDNPRLLVKSATRRQERLDDGRTASPIKVTVTGSGDLDPDAAFFTTGDAERLVYCPTAVSGELARRLGSRARVVDGGSTVELERVLEDLSDRGVERLMVEGGGVVLSRLLSAAVVDELRLAVAPIIVGESAAPRFVVPEAVSGLTVGTIGQRAELVEARAVGDVVVMRYALSDRFGAA